MGAFVAVLGEARAAAAFLTRLPVGARDHDAARMGGGIAWFPIIGVVIGALVGGVYALALQVVPPLVAATLAVAAGILATGAFHEDGLADTADALVGSADRESALRILKDPRLGTFGVLALILSVGFRVTALASFDALSGWFVMIVAHALSRSAAAGVLGVSRAATNSGLGAAFARGATRTGVTVAVILGLAPTVAFGAWSFAIVVGTLLAAAGLVRWSTRRIGGITGDILGAIQQLVEVSTLVIAAAAATDAGSIDWLG